MILNDVHQGIRKNKTKKRVGRGTGSGTGKTAGRGHKGDGSRAGHRDRLGFEGGQVPLARRVAKRGFNNKFFAIKFAIVNVTQLEKHFKSGEVVDIDTLTDKRLIQGAFDGVKILGNGALTKKLTVKAEKISRGAVEKILKAGGQVEELV